MSDGGPTKRQSARLRVVIRNREHVGLWGGITITGHDIYLTRAAGGIVKREDGRRYAAPIFNTRWTYHASGQQHSYEWLEPTFGFDGTRRRTTPTMTTAPEDLVGPMFMSSHSFASHAARWGYAPKQKKGYLNLVLQYSEVRHLPSFALDFWCFGDQSPSIPDLYPRGVRVLHSAEVDWTTPRLAAVVWTMSARGWLESAKAAGRPIPGPGDAALVRDAEGYVTVAYDPAENPESDDPGPIVYRRFRPPPT